jgi:hypothetical protein
MEFLKDLSVNLHIVDAALPWIRIKKKKNIQINTQKLTRTKEQQQKSTQNKNICIGENEYKTQRIRS